MVLLRKALAGGGRRGAGAAGAAGVGVLTEPGSEEKSCFANMLWADPSVFSE